MFEFCNKYANHKLLQLERFSNFLNLTINWSIEPLGAGASAEGPKARRCEYDNKIEEKSKNLMEKEKTQAKNSKLKEKTQGPGGFSLALPPKWC